MSAPAFCPLARQLAEKHGDVYLFNDHGVELEDDVVGALGGRSVTEALNDDYWFATRHGLCAPLYALNWVWLFPRAPYLGTALQAHRACRKWEIDPDVVLGANRERIRGTCLFVPGRDFPGRRRDWRMIQCATFPAWAGY